jgi:hypothetical protein
MRKDYCPNCGKEIGEHTVWSDPYDTCGRAECEREARRMYDAEREERMMRAEEDDYDRY